MTIFTHRIFYVANTNLRCFQEAINLASCLSDNNDLLLAILNIMTFFLFIGSYSTYKNRNGIIANEQSIENYRITKFQCSASYGNATVYILFNSKQYDVEINPYYCKELKKNKSTNIEFYYDKKKDKLFTKSALTKNMVITSGIIFLIFISFWFIPKRYW